MPVLDDFSSDGYSELLATRREWRFMLEDVSTRERQVFVNMAEMVEWLTAVFDPPAHENM